nr:hypothetical protein [Tanacetum cinerariifolium]
MNMGQDRHMQMVGGNGGNQFRQYAGQNAGNLNGYNVVQNVKNQVAQNPRVHNVRNQNQIGNGNLMAVRAEGNAAGHNGNQIRCYNCRGLGHFARNCTTDSAPVYDTDGSAENDNNVISEATNMEQGGETVEQHSANFEETRALYESLYQNLAIEVEKVNSVNHFRSKQTAFKGKSTVSFFLEEKKKLKSDFKTCEDELLDKQILLEKK